MCWQHRRRSRRDEGGEGIGSRGLDVGGDTDWEACCKTRRLPSFLLDSKVVSGSLQWEPGVMFEVGVRCS